MEDGIMRVLSDPEFKVCLMRQSYARLDQWEISAAKVRKRRDALILDGVQRNVAFVIAVMEEVGLFDEREEESREETKG